MRIKTIPKGHDELVLQRMEMQWRNILRRTRDADERRERREKEEQIKRDLQKLEDLRMGRIMPGEEINVSKEMLIAQSRQKRLEMEHSELQNEIDRKDGEERRAIVRKQIKEAKEASPTPLSRAASDTIFIRPTFPPPKTTLMPFAARISPIFFASSAYLGLLPSWAPQKTDIFFIIKLSFKIKCYRSFICQRYIH